MKSEGYMHDIPLSASGRCSSALAKEADLTMTVFLPGTERDLDTVALDAPTCSKCRS